MNHHQNDKCFIHAPEFFSSCLVDNARANKTANTKKYKSIKSNFPTFPVTILQFKMRTNQNNQILPKVPCLWYNQFIVHTQADQFNPARPLSHTMKISPMPPTIKNHLNLKKKKDKKKKWSEVNVWCLRSGHRSRRCPWASSRSSSCSSIGATLQFNEQDLFSKQRRNWRWPEPMNWPATLAPCVGGATFGACGVSLCGNGQHWPK